MEGKQTTPVKDMRSMKKPSAGGGSNMNELGLTELSQLGSGDCTKNESGHTMGANTSTGKTTLKTRRRGQSFTTD